jgi:hypothetical protein
MGSLLVAQRCYVDVLGKVSHEYTIGKMSIKVFGVGPKILACGCSFKTAAKA